MTDNNSSSSNISTEAEVDRLFKQSAVSHKGSRLFIVLGGFMLTNALIAEFMGVKIFSLEKTLGISPFVFNVFGEKIEGFSLTCGVLLWPFVFVMTDVINEYFGRRGVRFLSWIAAIMIAYGFAMVYLAMETVPAGWWYFSSAYGEELNYDHAYRAVFGQGMKIIVGSITAFLLGQLVDVTVFHTLKRKTGEKYIWLRATGSTLVSQLIDTFVVLFIAFYIGNYGQENQWSLQRVLAVGTVGYIYKFLMAWIMTPVIYLVHARVEKYLGYEAALEMKEEAMKY